MTDVFNSITINVEAVGPPREQAAEVSSRHIPGGDQTYVDIGGLLARTITYTLFFSTASAYETFEAQVGTQGTLTTTADGTNTAILLSLKRSERDLSSLGETSAVAEFLLT